MTIFKNREPKLSLNIDLPIYPKQIELLECEFSEIKKDRTDRWERMFFRYFDYISDDGYGSFDFWFDSDVLDLSIEEQERLQETLQDLYRKTTWHENLIVLYCTRENISEYTKEEFKDERRLEEYIEASIACGYNLSQSELFESFSGLLTKEEIDKITLLYRIKNPDFWES